MSLRPRMTTADYLAIAVSPALVMALVGSLVFFLIEVLYIGEYSLRLNYVFALFVFATVLIARIAIELGSELAAMYSIPLGLLTYLALLRFVEHPGPLSWLINLTLLALVWWCCHKLTWDCTVIDDNDDASGEGLLGRLGIDESPERGLNAPAVAENELLAGDSEITPWWKRLFRTGNGPHTPGVWGLYFSVAALPLFGIGQRWIPAGDVGRRRYAFALLVVYVAAALSLLVTTSFLGLRRYLRQRRLEMPAPMAATWVSLGAVLILLVMFAAALLPRPKAEYAISQTPWQAGSPGDQSANRNSIGDEGTVDESAQKRVTSDNQPQAPPGDEVRPEGQTPMATDQGEESARIAEQSTTSPQEQGESSSASGQSSSADSSSGSTQGSTSEQSSDPAQHTGEDHSRSGEQRSDDQAGDAASDVGDPSQPSSNEAIDERQGGRASDDSGADQNGAAASQQFERPRQSFQPQQILQALTSSVANLLKLIVYALLALAIVYLAWRYRAEIARAIAEIVQQLREVWARLFGRRGRVLSSDDEAATAPAARRRTFAEFHDPFLTGRFAQMPPVELVRYTFEAFEAWAGDHGRPRAANQTPQELLRGAVPPRSPMYEPASHLIRLYNEAAYAARPVPRDATSRLRDLWHLMQSTRQPPYVGPSASP